MSTGQYGPLIGQCGCLQGISSEVGIFVLDPVNTNPQGDNFLYIQLQNIFYLYIINNT